MRKLWIAGAIVALFGMPLATLAQQSNSSLINEVNTNWPDNTTGLITPALLRSTVIDIINSYYNVTALPLTITATGASLVINTNPIGTLNSSFYAYNNIQMTDTVTTNNNSPTYGLISELNVNQGASGPKFGILGVIDSFNATTNTKGSFTGIWGGTDIGENNGGTVSTPVGTAEGILASSILRTAASFFNSVIGAEIQTEVDSGGTVQRRIGLANVSAGSATGSLADAAFEITTSGRNTPYNIGLLLDGSRGKPALQTTGCIICTDNVAATIATGIDLSAWTINNNFIAGPSGFLVGGKGGMTTAVVPIASLPTCNANASVGMRMAVNNGATSPTYHLAVTTTAAAIQPVFCAGATGWVYD